MSKFTPADYSYRIERWIYIYIYVYVRGSFVINISIFIYDRFFTYNLIKALLVVRKEIIGDGEKDEDGERKIRL